MRRAPHTQTRRPRLIALAVLVCGLGSALSARGGHVPSERCPAAVRAARTTLRLHLIDRAGLPPEARRALMDEAIAPWLEAGVDVRWAADDLAAGGADDVYVTLSRAADDGRLARRPGHGQPLAAILFVDGRPTTQVTANVEAIERLAVAARIDDRSWYELPRLLRERLLGRAIGRAIAHEVGHYLFASSAHATGGLMRPHHPIERLMTAAGDPFRVIPP